MKTSITFLFILSSLFAFAQTNISGIINDYTKVLSLEPCTGTIEVADASPYSIGDKAILIQMQGAIINETNTNTFGTLTSLNNAGLYEQVNIAAVVGNEITVISTFLNEYDITGKVQLIRMPVYDEATVVADVIAQQWDGETGGVIAIEVLGTLSLDANINADGAGFRGGNYIFNSSNCTGGFNNATDWYYATDNWRGAPKGEGVAVFIAGKENGRGAQANGGGGGNDHNSGGGGGGNLSSGGDGGERDTPTFSFDCKGEAPGRGGKALAGNPNRLFMGGGGGAGHENNNVGGNGGNGGGIIFIKANYVFGDEIISARGLNGENTSAGDGAGGGGAGGVIFVEADNMSLGVVLRTDGGDGGDSNNSGSDNCFGPGGGAGAGTIYSTITTPPSSNNPGQPGITTNTSGSCNGSNNGAGAGASAETLTSIEDLALPQGTGFILPQITSEPAAMIFSCDNELVNLTLEVEGIDLMYQWQFFENGVWQDLIDDANYSGTMTASLNITNLSDNIDYQCIITDDCTNTLISNTFSTQIAPAPIANFTITDLGGAMYQFNNQSALGLSYFWEFGDMNTSIEENPTHTYDNEGSYEVTLTVTNDCGEATFTDNIIIGNAPLAGFTSNFQNGCAPLTIQFTDQSQFAPTSWAWIFEGGNPSTSSEQNPTVVYDTPGTYPVQLTVSNILGESDATQVDYIEILAYPDANFEFEVDTLTGQVFFTNLSQDATSYTWVFEEGAPSSNTENPQYIFDQAGVYLVTLTAETIYCSESISIQVPVNIISGVADLYQNLGIRAYPNPVQDKLLLQQVGNFDSAVSVRLMSLDGRVLMDKNWTNSKILSLSLENFNAGMYLAQVFSPKGIQTIKITKQ